MRRSPARTFDRCVGEHLFAGDDIATTADQAVVVALSNPDPEVDPFAAGKHAAIEATGRSDYPNQIINVLAFPGFFRGMLDSGAHEITDDLLLAAATAIADTVAPEELNPKYIVPSMFDPTVAPAVAAAIQKAIARMHRHARIRSRPPRGPPGGPLHHARGLTPSSKRR